MKTEYKLIKRYPSYDTLGIIVSSEDKTLEWKGTNYYEKYPEYWEKVVEKTYKILSFCYDGWEGKIAKLNNNGEYFTSKNISSWTLDQMLNRGKCVKSGDIKIHSVKRKSDDVIFTIGDKINRSDYKDIDVIRGFNLKDDLCLASISDEIDSGYMSSKGVNISAIEHVKNVLFTTEDNVDIIESTTCFAVSSHFGIYETDINKSISKEWYLNKTIFYSKENAEKYVFLHKPCLSINDLENIMKEKNCFGETLILHTKELVKTKL